jgi:hypothetical protein
MDGIVECNYSSLIVNDVLTIIFANKRKQCKTTEKSHLSSLEHYTLSFEQEHRTFDEENYLMKISKLAGVYVTS